MKKSKATRRALFSSVISLILCFAMLVGTTFAWFTDTVKTGVNKIVAGNLDIEVKYSKDGTTWDDLKDTDSLFSTNLWEPGHTEVVYLKITNVGTLALNYKVLVTPVSENGGVNVKNESFKLSDYLVFGTTAASSTPTTYTRAEARSAVGTTTGLADVNSLTKTSTMEGKTDNDPDVEYLALVVYMPEGVGNDANYKTGTTPPSIDLGITVLATQNTVEQDSFDSDYDENAVNTPFYRAGSYYNYFPQVSVSETVVANGDTVITATGKLNSTDTTNTTLAKVTVPAGAVAAGVTKLTVTVVPKEPTADTTTGTDLVTELNDPNRETANFDIKVEGIASNNDKPITVEVFVGKGLSNVKVYHNGALIDAVYSPTTGIATFTTTSFSDYTVAYDVAVAAIGSKTYGSLKLAVDAAQSGDTVVLLKNVTVEEMITIDSGKNFTLDLNGMSITATLSGVEGSNSVIDMDSTSLEIKDSVGTGKIVSDEYGITASNGGTITVTSGTIESGYAALAGNNTTGDMNFVINGGTLTSTQSEAIYMPGQQTLTITNGTINGGISARMGQITISGGTINGMTADQAADSFDEYWNYSGSAWIGDAIYVWGGTYTSTNVSNGNSCNINITGGTINGNAHNAIAVYDIANKYNQDITVNVSGNAVVNGPVVEDHSHDQGATNVDTTWNITGGTFSSDPSAYVASGYYAQQNGTNWSVEKIFSVGSGTLEDPFIISNSTQFYSINDGNNEGLYFKLANDITVDRSQRFVDNSPTTSNGESGDAVIPYLTNCTIDGDGHTVSVGLNCYMFGMVKNSTIKNVNFQVKGHNLTYMGTDLVFDNVDVSGKVNFAWNDGVYATYIYGGNNTLKDCANYTIMKGNWYSSVFVGYVIDSSYDAVVNFENCDNYGYLTCGYASLFVANPHYGKLTLNITNCHNYGTVHQVNDDEFFTPLTSVTWDGSPTYWEVTIDGQALSTWKDAQWSSFGGNYLCGPKDTSLEIVMNEDKTMTVTPAANDQVDHYVVAFEAYCAIAQGGSLKCVVSEKLANNTLTSTIKVCPFVDKTWVENNPTATKSEVNGFITYTLGEDTYYLIPVEEAELDMYTTWGEVLNISSVYVMAYSEDDTLLAVSTLQ